MMELLQATYETIKMSVLALFFSYLLGFPLGILTNETDKYGLFKNKVIHSICEVIIGFGRAVPFTILMVLTLPLTRFIVGTGIGSTACVIPLTIAAGRCDKANVRKDSNPGRKGTLLKKAPFKPELKTVEEERYTGSNIRNSC